MEPVILVVHLILAVALVATVLLQRSEGGGLGIGGGGGGGGLVSVRGSANLLTRATAILAACFMVTSLTLAILAGNRTDRGSILDRPAIQQPAAPQGTGTGTGTGSGADDQPTVPLSQ